MIPLGLAAAGAVRVGQALGRGEPASAGHAGWTALALGAGFMACAGLVFATMPGTAAIGVHHRPGRDRHRRFAHDRRGRLPAFRRPARRLDRRHARGRRYPHAHGLQPRVALVHRPADRLLALLRRRPRRPRPLGRAWRRGWPRPGSTSLPPGRARPGHSPAANTSWPAPVWRSKQPGTVRVRGDRLAFPASFHRLDTSPTRRLRRSLMRR